MPLANDEASSVVADSTLESDTQIREDEEGNTEAVVTVTAQDATSGSCDAFAILKDDAKVVTGYAGDTCDDKTVDQGLPFVPGTQARIEAAEEAQGGMVIIIDAKLEEATTFGEK